MIHFVDRSLGRKTPRALKAREYDVIAHDDVFAQNTDDEHWLPEVGRRGWIVLTKDDHIRFRPAERDALITFKVGCFTMMRRNDTWEQPRDSLLLAWPRIEEIGTSETRPFIYAIYQDGSIQKRDLS